MKRISVAVLAVVALVVAVGCEPNMRISAYNGEDHVTCGLVMPVVGVVSPKDATPKVVLQHTVNGQWVDMKGWGSKDDWYDNPTNPRTRTANVSKTNGGYSIAVFVTWFPPATKHLRVRSYGGGGTSPGFYATATGWDGDC